MIADFYFNRLIVLIIFCIVVGVFGFRSTKFDPEEAKIFIC